MFLRLGPGPESERFLERTFKLRPQKPPTAVQVFGINPSTIRVTWRYVSPSVAEEPLTGYRVRVWESDKDISLANDTVVYIGNKLEAIISDLTPGKSYFLRVLAFSQGGEGKMSSPAWQFQMGDPERLNGAPHMTEGRIVSLAMSVLVPLLLWRIV
jgi:Fibronectin type III domain